MRTMKLDMLADPALEREYLKLLMIDEVPHHLLLEPETLTDGGYNCILEQAMELRRIGKLQWGALADALQEQGRLELANVTLQQLMGEVPNVIIDDCVARLRRLSMARTARDSLLRAANSCERLDLEHARELATQAVEMAAGKSSTVEGVKTLTIRESVDAALDVYGTFDLNRQLQLIPLGIQVVDRAVSGLSKGQMEVLAADTGIGKSSLMLRRAKIQSLNYRIGIVSLEDNEDLLGSRSVAADSGVACMRIRTREISDGEKARLRAAADASGKYDMHIAYAVGGTHRRVLSAVTTLLDKGCQYLYVDYLQKVPSERGEDRRSTMNRLMSAIQDRCYVYGAPVTFISQLRRPPREFEKNRIPSRHDIKDSGDIPNEAHVILLIWRKDDDKDTVYGVVDKSKMGGEGLRFKFVRDGSGMLKEEVGW